MCRDRHRLEMQSEFSLSEIVQNALSVETKEWNIEIEVMDLLEDPNRRPLAWKLNQLGRKGQRK